MVEKLKEFTKRSFSNSPKAKIMIGAVVIVAIIATAVTMSMRKVLVIDIDGKEETFVTYKGTVKDVLQEKGIEVSPKDKLQPSLESKVSEKELIKLKRAVPVNISVNGTNLEIQTAENNVGDMLDAEEENLKEQGIEIDKDVDEVYPSLDSEVQENLNVKVVKVEAKDVVEKQPIKFDTVVEKDENLDKSVKKVKTEGTDGEKEVTYKVVYKDGVEASREVKSTKVISEPQNQVVVEGSGTIYASRGGSVDGKRQMICSATAYSGGWGTSSGRKPVRVEGGLSTIAVDPSVIPLGSKVYIEGYGYAVAADTGTAIKGNKIDLYFNSYRESCEWGLRQVQLTIIAYPGEW
ncbi:3D domain-containing protein [Clostridium sp.]|uniref:3D domain-containing protein n=1 Tax=Clostridium sp. TaxID=1506 RepID=UPI0026371807|nr:3D domain-containing protein [Clostridium sp.]